MTALVFDNDTVSKKLKQKLSKIENLDLEGGLDFINCDGDNYTALEEEDDQVMLKVDKKANVPGAIEDVISKLMDYLDTDRKTVNMVFSIHNYNNVIYVSKKY